MKIKTRNAIIFVGLVSCFVMSGLFVMLSGTLSVVDEETLIPGGEHLILSWLDPFLTGLLGILI